MLPEGMPDPIRKILSKMLGINDSSEENYDLRTVGELSDEEVNEKRSIDATGESLNIRYQKLMEERKIVEARHTLWWNNVRKHFNINDNFVHLEGNLVQVGTPKERSKEEQQF